MLRETDTSVLSVDRPF